MKKYIKFIDEKGDLKIETKEGRKKAIVIDVKDNMTITELYQYLHRWFSERNKKKIGDK